MSGHIHHKRGVTEVWHIAHFWVSYDRCAMSGLPMGWSEGLDDKQIIVTMSPNSASSTYARCW